MRDASTPKRKLTTKIFHVNSFAVLFPYIFLLMWQFKILIECFSSNQLDKIKYLLFFKNWIQEKCFKFCCLYHQIYFIQPWRYSAVSRGKFGHTSTMWRFDLSIPKQYFVIEADTDIGMHKVIHNFKQDV